MNSRKSDISGIWLTTYTYHSSINDTNQQSRHYMVARSEGRKVTMETIPEFNDSYMLANFSKEGNVLTGTWHEATNINGQYSGAVYHGAGHLIISDDGKTIKGKWVGFGKNMDVKTGDWGFVYLGDDTTVIPDVANGQ